MVSDTLVANDKPKFRWENNVVVGEKVPNKYPNYSNVGELLLERMKSVSNRIAQYDEVTGTEDTFAALSDRVIKCALWLKKQGVRPGDIVALCAPYSLNSVVPCVAAACIGAIFNSWDPEMNLLSARHFAQLTQPKVIFISESKVGIAQDAFKIEGLSTTLVKFDEDAGGTVFSETLKGHTAKEIANFQCENVDVKSTLLILFSSGTTGLPKGVQLSHESVFYHLSTAAEWKWIGRIPMWYSNFYGIVGTLRSISCLVQQTKRIILPFFDEKRNCELIQKHKISWMFLSPNLMNRWVKSGYPALYDLSGLECIMTGGGVITSDMQTLWQKSLPNVEILQSYGMTEIGGITTCQNRDSPSGSCGLVCANVQIKIINPETGKILGPNERGEIMAKATTMTSGFYKNPEATRQNIDEEGWLHTGDLGYLNDDGELFIIDRLKELIKCRGLPVAPAAIENVLLTHPAVVGAVVVGIPDPTDDEHPIAFVKLAPGSNVTAQELIDMVERKMMDRERLRGGLRFVEKFPETSTGKISRKDVKLMAKEIAVKE